MTEKPDFIDPPENVRKFFELIKRHGLTIGEDEANLETTKTGDRITSVTPHHQDHRNPMMAPNQFRRQPSTVRGIVRDTHTLN